MGSPSSGEISGSEMGLDRAGPRQRAQLTARRIPEPVPAPRNQFPAPSGEIAKLK